MSSLLTEFPTQPITALAVDEERLPPVRGIVPLQNKRGKPYNLVDIKRWLRLHRLAFGCEKVDVLAARETMPRLHLLLEYAGEIGLRLSLRTTADGPPPDLRPLADAGLLDVFITPTRYDAPQFQNWMTACRNAEIPFRIQIQGPFEQDFDAAACASRLLEARPNVVNVAAYDPFVAAPGARNDTHAQVTIQKLNALAQALVGHEVEVNILRIPFCLIDKELWPYTINTPQFFRDHQQYERESYEMAASLFQTSTVAAAKVLLILLSRSTFERTFSDAVLLRLFLYVRFAHNALLGLHKATHHLHRLRGRPREDTMTFEEHERALERQETRNQRALGPELATCSMRRISDGKSFDLDQALPGLKLHGLNGELIVSPMHFAQKQPKYYDEVDTARRVLPGGYEALIKKANDIVENQSPTRQLMPYEYQVENAPFEHLEGGVRWHSISTREKRSTPLAMLEPPFTLSVSFGGGIAEYIGFSFGRHCKVLCPMEEYRHKLVLHVEADGHYVLLRDGKRMRPVEFRGEVYAPLRLGGVLEPRISCWNIDGKIVTQFVKFWVGAAESDSRRELVRYSVVIVNSRYARRLQATLRSLAHQRDFDMSQLEVIVCYIPGQDATDDVIDSIQAAHPNLRIVRAPFRERNTNAKGYMINEAVQMAAGEFVCLMDADILLAPDMFARIHEAAEHNDFIAPDGRKMLTKETTAKVLLGDLTPWDDWESLLEGAGEYRYREAKGVPVGFLQVFRKSFMDEVKYAELDHFEGADMWFGMALQKEYGKETRLSGRPVLHLDHGGSQWYGTQKHW